MKKINPSKTESSAATALQAPTAAQPRTVNSEDAPKALQSISAFKSLAKVSRSARLAFGSAMQWIKPEMLFNSGYRDGVESTPFFITKAFKYKSKEISGDRLGIEIALSNGKMYNVGFGLNDGDSKRSTILAMFIDDDGKPRANAEPVGPFCITMLPTDKGNDYYDIVPFETVQPRNADIDIPFVEIPLDDEVPF